MKYDSYNEEFFAQQEISSAHAASVIAPLIVSMFHPKRVVDIGCGIGVWLRAFKEQGCTVVTGFDGDYVDRTKLAIDSSEFHAVDLSKPLVDKSASYDLAVSLEVAEHIAPEFADTFVENLTQMAPLIVFSAAIPGQGGTLHVNEQWPSYWTQKFAQHGYLPIDCIRPQIWDCDQIAWYYIQNILVYARSEAIAEHPSLARAYSTKAGVLDIVHPRQFAYLRHAATDFENIPVADAINHFVRSMKGFLQRRLGRNTYKPYPR